MLNDGADMQSTTDVPLNNGLYFYRCAVFTRQNKEIALADIHNPEQVMPLESWMGVVISLADGQHTIAELIGYMAQQYPMPPQNLEKTLHSVIERMQEGNLLQLSDAAVALPYYLVEPIETLDIDKAKQLIAEDGYGLH